MHHSNQPDHESVSTSHVQANALFVVTVGLKLSSIVFGFYFFVLSPATSVTSTRGILVVLLIEISNEPGSAIRLVQKEFFGKYRLWVHIKTATRLPGCMLLSFS